MGAAAAGARRGGEELNEPPPFVAPPPGTVERWAWDYVTTTDLDHKLAPPAVPSEWEEAPPPRRIERPGRPEGLVMTSRAPHKTPGPVALQDPLRRVQLVHTFLHHELQAAELMAWALLAFPDTPRAFRVGLVHIAHDEIRHMAMYDRYLAALGVRFGQFPVRDWFWARVPTAATPAHFVAVMGMGLEGGNLDHTRRFAERFRGAGDEEGARLQEIVGDEEVPHVRFGLRWFRRFTAGVDFDAWRRHLPPPLSPVLMRGLPLNRTDRRRAGFSDVFLDELERWTMTTESPGS